MKPAKWAVVATVDEPAALIAAFARHHLAAGASDVHVFLDAPCPEAIALLSGLEGCHVTLCDDVYWANSRRKGKPRRHTARQKYNADSVYRTTKADWLLHCDADEFVSDGAALADELRRAGELGYLRLPNIERVHLSAEPGEQIFEGGFRTALPDFDLQGPLIYGRFAKFLNRGVTGHLAGKGIVRTGNPYLMGVHFPRLEDDRRDVPFAVASTEILHFDGLTPLHFALKLLRRAFEQVSGPPRPHGDFRKAQFAYVKNHAQDAHKVLRLANGVQRLDMEQAAALKALGALKERTFVPLDCGGLDLSPTSFDAELRARNSDLIAKAQLAL